MFLTSPENFCHPSIIQRLKDRYQATGTGKDRRRPGQPKVASGVTSQLTSTLCIDDIYIDDIRSSRLLSVPKE